MKKEIEASEMELKKTISKINERKSKYDFLPSDVANVIICNNTVVVNLNNGIKGVSKCNHKYEFDAYTGFTIAYYKARNSKSFKLKQALDNCLQNANKKGYDKAILKNY